MAEMVDIVDDRDRVVRVVTRAEMRARRLKHRCVFIVVRSTKGEVLIHRRAETKDLWPGRWDMAVGGVLRAGEGYDQGAARELFEEVGVNAPLVPLGAATYQDQDVDEVARLYTATHDGPFAFTDGEVVEALFVTVDELAARIARDRFVPDSLKLAWPLTGLRR